MSGGDGATLSSQHGRVERKVRQILISEERRRPRSGRPLLLGCCEGYLRSAEKRRTLGISLRTAAGCFLAGLIVNIPQFYEHFRPEVRSILSNSVVFVTFGVGDSVGETLFWCASGVAGTLAAFLNYRFMVWFTSLQWALLHPGLCQALYVAHFFLTTLLVNLADAPYMFRQMVMGYYASYGLCLANPQCDLREAGATDLWTTIGALISILVMLVPPRRTAQTRVYGGPHDESTLEKIVRTTARVCTTTSAAHLVIEEQRCAGGSSDSSLRVSVQVIQESLDELASLLSLLESDVRWFWFEAALLNQDRLLSFAQTMRDVEGSLIMQRQSVLFALYSWSSRSATADAAAKEWVSFSRRALNTANAKGMRLLTLACEMLQACRVSTSGTLLDAVHQSRGGKEAHARKWATVCSCIKEARAICKDVGDWNRETRVWIAKRNLASLPDLGTGRVLLLLNMTWLLASLKDFTLKLCDDLDELVQVKSVGGELVVVPPPISQRLRLLRARVWQEVLIDIKAQLQKLKLRGRPWGYALKATVALTTTFVISAYYLDFEGTSVAATAYILGAPGKDARCLGGTIWKALGRILGLFCGGVLPGVIHNIFVPASGIAEDCAPVSHVVNSLGSVLWCFIGLHLYKMNGMVTVEHGHFGYMGLVLAFVAAEQFLSGCNRRVEVSEVVVQAAGGAFVLLVTECVFSPYPATVALRSNVAQLFQRQTALLEGAAREAAPLRVASRSASGLEQSLLAGEVWTSRARERYKREITWLVSSMRQSASAVKQALTEDTFKLGHLFFPFMPKGFSCEPFREQLHREVLSYVQQVHINILFFASAREVDEVIVQSASQQNIAEAGRPQWQSPLERDLDGLVGSMQEALGELAALVEHGLANDWAARDLFVEAAAGVMLQQACAPQGSEEEAFGQDAARRIFASVLRHVDPELSFSETDARWLLFEERLDGLQRASQSPLGPAEIRAALAEALRELSQRPSLSTGRLDSWLRFPGRVLRHRNVGVKVLTNAASADLKKLRDEQSPGGESHRLAADVCYQLAMLDCALLLAHLSKALTEILGHSPMVTAAEEDEDEPCVEQ